MTQCWIVPPVAGLVELVPAPEMVVNERPAVEWMGEGNVCVYLARRQLPLDGADFSQPVVVGKIIKPLSQMMLALPVIAECLQWNLARSGREIPAPEPFRPHIVR